MKRKLFAAVILAVAIVLCTPSAAADTSEITTTTSITLVVQPSPYPYPPPVPGDIDLSPEFVVGIVAAVLAAAAYYIEEFSPWWGTFKRKRLAVAAMNAVVVCAVVGLHYAGAVDLGLGQFGWPVAMRAFNVWLISLGAAWVTHGVATMRKQ